MAGDYKKLLNNKVPIYHPLFQHITAIIYNRFIFTLNPKMYIILSLKFIKLFTTLNFSGISTNISNKSFEYGEVQSSILSGDNFSKQNT